jgi:hypothetical protein
MRFAARKALLCAFFAAWALAPWRFAVADVTVPVGTSHPGSEAEGGQELEVAAARGHLPARLAPTAVRNRGHARAK